MRRTALKQKDLFPDAAQSILKDTYVDDCVTGSDSTDNAAKLSSDIIELLAELATKPTINITIELII